MKYNDVINHPSLKDYFGKNSEKWINSLNLLVEKKNLGEKEVDDKEARGLLIASQKFSWLGFFLNFFWAAYLNKTSNLSSPSWGRVAVAFLIIFGGLIALAIISEL